MEDKITIRECALTDCESIYLLNKNDLGYDFPIEKTAERLEMILKSEKIRFLWRSTAEKL